MDGDRQHIALEILDAIAQGALPLRHFTADARWWWNGGLDLTVAAFNDLLSGLHAQMEWGIVVTPGLVLQEGSSLMVEATSDGLLKNGKRYNNRYVFLFHFEGDAVREVREYSDSAHVLATFDLPAA